MINDTSSQNTVGDQNKEELAKLAKAIPNFLLLPDAERVSVMKQKILQYHKLTGTRDVYHRDLTDAVGLKNYKYDYDKDTYYAVEDAIFAALTELRLSFDLEFCFSDDDDGYDYCFLNQEEKNKKISEKNDSDSFRKKRQIADELLECRGKSLSNDYLNLLPINTWLLEEEFKSIFFEFIISKGVADDYEILNVLFHRIIEYLDEFCYIMKNTSNDGETIYFRTDEISKPEALKIKESEWKKGSDKATLIAEQKEKEAKELMRSLNRGFTSDYPVFTEEEILQNLNNNRIITEYDYVDIVDLLPWCVYSGLLEFDGKTFSCPGEHQKITIERKSELIRLIEANKQLLAESPGKVQKIFSRLTKLKENLKEQEAILNGFAGKMFIFGKNLERKKESEAKIQEIKTKISKLEKRRSSIVAYAKKAKIEIDKFEKELEELETHIDRHFGFYNKDGVFENYPDSVISVRKEILKVLTEKNIPMNAFSISINSESIDIMNDWFNKDSTYDEIFTIIEEMANDFLLIMVEIDEPLDYYCISIVS